MATYVPGSQIYVPQYQPWQPDYNFLGNVLQTRQNRYDQNYKQLSETYGTLLNSPMLREDNIQQRNEFFKMVDDDIKRMSGLDLSLQQNVDAANAVFESFYQNKSMVKDMTYTKEYQNQLQIAENYRNCIDQEKCGGKYWDTGVQGLHYRADEFKKASKEEAMNMSPGRFAPMINIQEKAMVYAEKLLGKGGSFGVQNVEWSKDGRYIITMKNGQLLQVPLQQLLLNQFGQDQNIQDMFNEQAYVNRKGYVAQNAAKFGGNEDAAEDEYFSIIDREMTRAQEQYKEAQEQSAQAKAKKIILEKAIQENGSTGYDFLADDYEAASIDSDAFDQASKQSQSKLNIANSIFEAGDNRKMRRQRVDALLGKSLMEKSLMDSATVVASMTGSVEVKEDPYAKSYFDSSLRLQELRTQYDLMDRNELRKNVYDLSKQQALQELKKRGSAVGPSNQGVPILNYLGAASGELREVQEAIGDIKNYTSASEVNASNYYTGYADTLAGIIADPNKTGDEKRYAGATLQKIFGRAKRNDQGQLVGGYDPETNKFYDDNGQDYTDVSTFAEANRPKWRDYFNGAQNAAKENRSLPSHQEFINSKNAQTSLQNYELNQQELRVSTKVWKENNKAVKDYVNTHKEKNLTADERKYWNSYYRADNSIKTEEEFLNDVVKIKETEFKMSPSKRETVFYEKGERITVEKDFDKDGALKDAKDLWKKYNETYAKVYNESDPVNGRPITKALRGTSELGYAASGKATRAIGYTSKTNEPGSAANSGLLTFYDDALGNGIFAFGNYATMAEVGKSLGATKDNPVTASDDAKAAIAEWKADLLSGKLSADEKAEAANMVYMDTALSSADWEGLQVFFPESWLAKKRGTKDETTWADNADLKKGVTMYTNKKTAKNTFHESYEAKPYDWMINHDDINVNINGGGTLTIKKRRSDGTVLVTGQLEGINKNGETEFPPFSEIYGPETGGQNIFDGINVFLSEISKANANFRAGQPLPKIRDLRKIVQTLNTKAGDAPQQEDLSQTFRDRVQFNLQMMGQQE